MKQTLQTTSSLARSEFNSIGELFLHTVRFNPDAPFLNKTGCSLMSYSAASRNLTSVIEFLENKGIQRGSRVILIFDDIVANIFAVLAGSFLGVIMIPVASHFSNEYIRSLVKRTGASAVLTDCFREGQKKSVFEFPMLVLDLAQLPIRAISFEQVQKRLIDYLANLNLEQPFIIQMTSGSTGEPKLVMRTHQALLLYAKHLGGELRNTLRVPAKILMAPRLTHSFGFHIFCCALSLAGQLDIPDQFDVSLTLSTLQRLDSNVLPLLPRVLKSLHSQALASGVALEFGPSARFMLSAGGPSEGHLLKKVEKSGVQVIEFYGSSEASLMSMTPIGARHPGTVGRPISEISLRISKENEILVRSPGLMLGYFEDEESTMAAYTPEGYYRTGDLGEILPDGSLRILGRVRDVIGTRYGYAINPEKIELQIEAIPGVREVVVVSSSLAHLTALIVARPGSDQEQIKRKIRQLNESLEVIEKIDHFLLVESGFDSNHYRHLDSGKTRKSRNEIKSYYEGELSNATPIYPAIEGP